MVAVRFSTLLFTVAAVSGTIAVAGLVGRPPPADDRASIVASVSAAAHPGLDAVEPPPATTTLVVSVPDVDPVSIAPIAVAPTGSEPIGPSRLPAVADACRDEVWPYADGRCATSEVRTVRVIPMEGRGAEAAGPALAAPRDVAERGPTPRATVDVGAPAVLPPTRPADPSATMSGHVAGVAAADRVEPDPAPAAAAPVVVATLPPPRPAVEKSVPASGPDVAARASGKVAAPAPPAARRGASEQRRDRLARMERDIDDEVERYRFRGGYEAAGRRWGGVRMRERHGHVDDAWLPFDYPSPRARLGSRFGWYLDEY